jgi:hypothetical protein
MSTQNQSTAHPSPAVAALLGNIVLDPCTLSLGKPEILRGRGETSFARIPLMGAGQLRHQEMLRTERRLAGSY